MRQVVLGAAWGALVMLVAACGSMASCQPVPVTVAQKDDRPRLEMVPRGFTSETGRLQEIRVPEVVHEYWVRAPDGTWYRVSADQFRAVEVGGTIELCR